MDASAPEGAARPARQFEVKGVTLQQESAADVERRIHRRRRLRRGRLLLRGHGRLRHHAAIALGPGQAARCPQLRCWRPDGSSMRPLSERRERGDPAWRSVTLRGQQGVHDEVTADLILQRFAPANVHTKSIAGLQDAGAADRVSAIRKWTASEQAPIASPLSRRCYGLRRAAALGAVSAALSVSMPVRASAFGGRTPPLPRRRCAICHAA